MKKKYVSIALAALGFVILLTGSYNPAGLSIIVPCGTDCVSVVTTVTTYQTVIASTATTTTITTLVQSTGAATISYSNTQTTTTFYSTGTQSVVITQSTTSTSTQTQIEGAQFLVNGQSVNSGEVIASTNPTLTFTCAAVANSLPVSSCVVSVTSPSESTQQVSFTPSTSGTYTMTQSGNYAITGSATFSNGQSLQELSITGSISNSSSSPLSSMSFVGIGMIALGAFYYYKKK